jgi:hypothetical protein
VDIALVIPGVQHAVTGRVLMESARYRYGWLLSFCSEPVIYAYMNHPDHQSLIGEQCCMFRCRASTVKIFS